jgi:hypothetical protein
MEQKRRAVDLWSSVVFVTSGGEANLTLLIAFFKALHQLFVDRKLKPPQVGLALRCPNSS